ncbi:LADA_0B01860g1_1 [Lachancea dasiensis]|uniref:LADA_0B01860g1_1 n=1 Tax=Lachancea dasiensis TaxID=1072105 RepID=A0A1G4IS36_9SACH|nr:LADA_0B01860g1_1 [Lachancea dasiensis]
MVDSISRITSALESARELTLDAAAVASSRLGETSYHRYSQKITPEGLRSLLSSRNAREVRDGMKRVASLMASDDPNVDLELYFADVVKNIGSSTDIKDKRLVAVYLLRFAERQPSLALLAVNSIQKSLADPDSQTRALALKMLSDIKIASLYPIVLHSVKKAVTDSAPEVRSAVCFACLKLFREQRDSYADDIYPLLKGLLADSDPAVVSSALVLLKEAFPQHLELLHGHFRRYCEILPQLTQWSQAYLIDLLIDYCKTYVARPVLTDASDQSQSTVLPEVLNPLPYAKFNVSIDPDLNLFLNSITKMLYSPNSAVIISISKALFELSTPTALRDSKTADVLARLISSPGLANDQGAILQCILVYCTADPTTFSPFLKKFFLFPSDDTDTAVYKLKIIAALVSELNIKQIVSELKYYITVDKRSRVVQEALNALAVCGQFSQSLSLHITKWLLDGLENPLSPSAMNSYVSVVRFLIQENPSQHLGAMIQLAKTLQTRNNLSGNAKAGIIWLFGEFATTNFSVCPDLLRVFLPRFSYEAKETRLQIVLFAAKILSCEHDLMINKNKSSEGIHDIAESRIGQMAQSIFYLAKFDDDFDIRDRARLFHSLFDKERFEIASLLLQAPKPPSVTSYSFNTPHALNTDLLAKMGLDHDMEEYLTCLPWSEEDVVDKSSTLRTPCDVKDYNRLKTSFSSASFFHGDDDRHSTRGKSENAKTMTDTSHRVFTSAQGRKYQLQSLDEFFSDLPTTERKNGRKAQVQEESDEESGDSSQESFESDEYGSSESSDNEQTDEETDSDHEEDNLNKA